LPDCEILVPHDQSDLTLFRLTTHPATKAAKLGQVGSILNVCRGRVAMNQNRLILDERSGALIIAPDAAGFRIGRGAAEDA
jgi:hypothetical protein